MTSPTATSTHAAPTGNGSGHRMLHFMYRHLSKHAKHIFFIASLHGHFSHYSQHEEMAIDKLNTVIDLAYRTRSLEFPYSLHAKVWGPTKLEEILTESTLQNALQSDTVAALALKIVDASPQWMRYTSETEMVEDVSHWMKSLRPELTQKAA